MQRQIAQPLGLVILLSTLILFAGCASPAPAAMEFDSAMPEPAASAPDPTLAEMWEEEGFAYAQAPGESERRVISTARLELVVEDAGATADRITAIAAENEGYVGSTNLYKTSYGGTDALRGTITLRVPAEALERVIDQLEALAVDVRSKTTDRQDVTDQYTDFQARLRTLEATETELLELLAEVRAKPEATADEIMAVYHRLTEIRTEIERLQGRLNLLDSQIRLSTLEVSLIPDPAGRPVVQAGWQPGTEARAALRTLVSATQGLANLVIWAALFILPLLLLMLIPLAIAAYVLRLLYRRYGRRKTPVQPA